MEPSHITDAEFGKFRELLFSSAGISLSPAKKPLVSGRLAKRLRHHGLRTYGQYYDLLSGGRNPAELQIAIDLLTTNETYFFREPKHFDFLRARLAELPRIAAPFRVWSAASSTGEEAYTIAMVLSESLKSRPWEIVGTDISTRVIARARTGHYPMERAHHIPRGLLTRYCLKGIGEQAGTLLINKELRSRVQFVHANLNSPLPDLGLFDVVFLRNVMIYFDMDTKRQVVKRILPLIKSGGYFMVGHSESLHDITDAVQPVATSIYRKP